MLVDGSDRNLVEISMIAPAMNEAGNLTEYVERCHQAFDRLGVRGEIVIVDDGSSDNTPDVLQKLVTSYPHSVRGFRHRRNLGQTQALKTAVRHASGRYLMFLWPDLEAHPDEDIPIYYEALTSEPHCAVAGARLGRGDGKDVASWIYNRVSGLLFGLRLRDMNWMKAFPRDALQALELRSDWHRFVLPMLHRAGYRILERDVNWYPRRYGKSKYGLERIPKSFVDSVSLWFMLSFSRRPMRLFGSVGLIALLLGILIHVGLTALFVGYQMQIRPLFWTALALELVGLNFVLFGFVAELVERIKDDLESLRLHMGEERAWWVEFKPEVRGTPRTSYVQIR